MNRAQLQKYGICGGQAVRAMRALGHTGTDRELRHTCIRVALGYDRDATRLNNKEFDAVLAIFAGYHSMSDLAEQLRLLDQPKLRAMTAAAPFLDEIGVEQDRREQYVRTIYTRVQARRPAHKQTVYDLDQIPDWDIALILAALNHTAEHKHGIQHSHPHTARGRARFDHRVGCRRKDADPPKPMQNAPENAHNRIEPEDAELF